MTIRAGSQTSLMEKYVEIIIMMKRSIQVFALLVGLAASGAAQRQMENLTRGVVAVKQAEGIK